MPESFDSTLKHCCVLDIMRTLLTRDNIIEGMLWLVEGAQPNDSLFFHYSGRGFCSYFVFSLGLLFAFLLRRPSFLSGHGSQSTDYDGDEVDGSDETICPVDYKVLYNTVNEQCV